MDAHGHRIQVDFFLGTLTVVLGPPDLFLLEVSLAPPSLITKTNNPRPQAGSLLSQELYYLVSTPLGQIWVIVPFHFYSWANGGQITCLTGKVRADSQ